MTSVRTVRVEDAPAIQAIHAPIITQTAISFEETPPSVEEVAARI